MQNGLFHLSFHNSVRTCDHSHLSITHEEAEVCGAEGTRLGLGVGGSGKPNCLAPEAASPGGLQECCNEMAFVQPHFN